MGRPKEVSIGYIVLLFPAHRTQHSRRRPINTTEKAENTAIPEKGKEKSLVEMCTQRRMPMHSDKLFGNFLTNNTCTVPWIGST